MLDRDLPTLTPEEADRLDELDRQTGVAAHQNGVAKMEAGKIWRWCNAEELAGGLETRSDPLTGPITREEVSSCCHLVLGVERKQFDDWTR